MKIYLMADYSRRAYLRTIAKSLNDMGHEVTSRWIKRGEYPTALEYIEDLRNADTCIGFSEPPRKLSRGVRHVDFGIALVSGKRIIVVGGVEHVYHTLPQIEHVENIGALYQSLQ